MVRGGRSWLLSRVLSCTVHKLMTYDLWSGRRAYWSCRLWIDDVDVASIGIHACAVHFDELRSAGAVLQQLDELDQFCPLVGFRVAEQVPHAGRSGFDFPVSGPPPAPSEGSGPPNKKQKQTVF